MPKLIKEWDERTRYSHSTAARATRSRWDVRPLLVLLTAKTYRVTGTFANLLMAMAFSSISAAEDDASEFKQVPYFDLRDIDLDSFEFRLRP